MVREAVLGCGLAGIAVCQSLPERARPTFEVVSIKPTSGNDPCSLLHGYGPPRITPARIEFKDTSISALIGWAYRLPSSRISGPSWLQDVRFDVIAKMPEGTTVRETQEMTLSMLTDRFKLVAHKMDKPVSVYALKAGPSGIKLKETTGSAGGPCKSGSCRGYSCRKLTMRALALNMSQSYWQRMAGLSAGIPVVDLTGLDGNYDLDLPIAWAEGFNGAKLDEGCAGGYSVFAALKAVGLILEQEKQMQQFVVVDSVLRSPIPN